VLLYCSTSLSLWDNLLSHDQTGYNIIIMVSLDLYNRRHNALVLRNYSISVVCNLFLVPFPLDLIHTP